MFSINTTRHETRNLDFNSKENTMTYFISSHGASRILSFALVVLLGVALVGPARAVIFVGNPPDIGIPVIYRDTDGDGVMDPDDNCITVPNAGSLGCDADRDGYGNACDADFNNDGVSDGVDYASPHFMADFVTGTESLNLSGFHAQGTDMNCDGAVDGVDFGHPFFLRGFGAGAPGPSGLACAGTVPCSKGPSILPDDVVIVMSRLLLEEQQLLKQLVGAELFEVESDLDIGLQLGQRVGQIIVEDVDVTSIDGSSFTLYTTDDKGVGGALDVDVLDDGALSVYDSESDSVEYWMGLNYCGAAAQSTDWGDPGSVMSMCDLECRTACGGPENVASCKPIFRGCYVRCHGDGGGGDDEGDDDEGDDEGEGDEDDEEEGEEEWR